MKAVNLIPLDARGRSGPFGRSSGPQATVAGLGAYAVVAVLALAVVMAGAWAFTGRQLSDKRADLSRTEQAAQAAEAKVAELGPYTEFASLSRARVQTLRQLIDGRFNWSLGLREVARVVPSNVKLISLVGTTSPTAGVAGAGGGGSLRSALPVPAIDLIGCAKSQSHVARLLARLRAIDGVQRVSLASSQKADSASAGGSDCRATSQMPQFQITIFFAAPTGIVPAATAATTTSATPAATPGGTK